MIIKDKPNFLDGLTEVEPQDYDEVMKLNPLMGATTVPFYYEDGQMVPIAERMNIIGSGNYITKVYMNDKKEIKLLVVRLMTEEEKRKSRDTIPTPQIRNHLVGKNAIPFSVIDISGNKYSFENGKDLKGKIIVMNFWFLGCYPCLKEIPELNKLVDQHKGNDVIFLSFARDKKDKLDEYLETHPFKYSHSGKSIDI